MYIYHNRNEMGGNPTTDTDDLHLNSDWVVKNNDSVFSLTALQIATNNQQQSNRKYGKPSKRTRIWHGIDHHQEFLRAIKI